MSLRATAIATAAGLLAAAASAAASPSLEIVGDFDPSYSYYGVAGDRLLFIDDHNVPSELVGDKTPAPLKGFDSLLKAKGDKENDITVLGAPGVSVVTRISSHSAYDEVDGVDYDVYAWSEVRASIAGRPSIRIVRCDHGYANALAVSRDAVVYDDCATPGLTVADLRHPGARRRTIPAYGPTTSKIGGATLAVGYDEGNATIYNWRTGATLRKLRNANVDMDVQDDGTVAVAYGFSRRCRIHVAWLKPPSKTLHQLAGDACDAPIAIADDHVIYQRATGLVITNLAGKHAKRLTPPFDTVVGYDGSNIGWRRPTCNGGVIRIDPIAKLSARSDVPLPECSVELKSTTGTSVADDGAFKLNVVCPNGCLALNIKFTAAGRQLGLTEIPSAEDLLPGKPRTLTGKLSPDDAKLAKNGGLDAVMTVSVDQVDGTDKGYTFPVAFR